MTKCTKDAARYPNRDEAMEASLSCRRQCRKDYKDNDAIDKCFAECGEGDWSFEQDAKFSEQLHSILNNKFNNVIQDLYTMSGDLDLMGL